MPSRCHGGRKSGRGSRIVPQKADDQGYLYVMLSKNGVEEKVYVHEIVARTHLGPRPPGMKPAHKNGDKTDNRASNLHYVPDSPLPDQVERRGRTYDFESTHRS